MLIRRFMGLFFRLLYHPFAWSYDLVAAVVSLGKWQRWVRAVLPWITGPNVLELGFGPGHLQKELLKQNLRVCGLDESNQMIRIASRRLGNHRRLARGHAQNLPFPDNYFHTVVSTFPARYIFDPQTAEETFRVLVPGGKLVVLLAAWITGDSLAERAMRSLFQFTGQVPPEGEPLGERIHAPYRLVGFHTSEIFLDLPGSRLLLLVMEKPGGNK